jgi:DNA-binding MarR family transcriptional regulator
MTQAPTGADVSGDAAFRAVEHELGLLIRRARALSAQVARDVHPELEPGPYGLLVRLAEVAPARSSDLAEFFCLGKATVSRQLKALAELGLIGRQPDPVDGRAHLLVLTTEGRQRLDRARSAREQRFRGLLQTWQQEDVEQLAQMLGRFNTLTQRWVAAEPRLRRAEPAPSAD